MTNSISHIEQVSRLRCCIANKSRPILMATYFIKRVKISWTNSILHIGQTLILRYCMPKMSWPILIVTYFIKWCKNSWTDLKTQVRNAQEAMTHFNGNLLFKTGQDFLDKQYPTSEMHFVPRFQHFCPGSSYCCDPLWPRRQGVVAPACQCRGFFKDFFFQDLWVLLNV